MTTATLPWISAPDVFSRLAFGAAVRAVQHELRGTLDPAADFDRSVLELERGQLLMMPAQSARFVGVKVATVAPGNPARGLDRIQGVYLLMDAATLTPIALLDGAAITTLRTPAVSAAAADYLAPAEVQHLVVFGTGPQAWGHIEAMRSIRALERVTIVARNQGRAEDFAARVTAGGPAARVGGPSAVHDAQLIVCATTAREPLFDGERVPDDSCTVAVGSHEAGARELDTALMVRAQVVVEDAAAALREAGDVIIPVAEGRLDPRTLVPFKDVVTDACSVDRSRPRVFKSTGMSWEDLVIATAVYLSDSAGQAPGPPAG